MDAVEFLNARLRMYNTDPKSYKELLSVKGHIDEVYFVEKWDKDNPQKTRLQDFLEKYPLAQIKDLNGRYNFCCELLGYGGCKYFGDGCSHCWNEYVD